MTRVFLIGMPGVGKSHWGRLWSRVYHFELFDLDKMIVRKSGNDIPTLIATLGEPGFRELETEALVETIAATEGVDAIISCGGGTPVIDRNLRLMLHSGCVVYLEAGTGEILQQLRRSKVPRPLLRDLTEASVAALLEGRREYYERAHLKIPVATAWTGTFAEILQACINRHL